MEFVRRINYYETDKMGVVHHSNYVRYFEEARVWLMDSFGLSYFGLESKGIMIPVLGVRLEYKQPLTFGDDILIDTRISQLSGVKMTVSYKAYRKADMALTTIGESDHCFVDAKTFKPINIKRKAPEVYEAFQRLAEEINKGLSK